VKGYEAVMPRLRAIQWMILLDVALVAREHWSRLEGNEQRQLAQILRRGRHMSARDRSDLRRIVAKLELLDAGRELMPIVGRRGKKRS
jgi:hypothetical protein